MPNLQDLSQAELKALYADLLNRYNEFKEKDIHLDMSRGKPSKKQLDLSMGMLDVIRSDSDLSAIDGTDCRNYGVLDGIPECKEFFAEMMHVDPKNVIVGGNSTLNMIFDYITQCMTNGSGGRPWETQDDIKMICLTPGYDRHFAICEFFGIEMINVPLREDGPDMELLEEAIKDPSVKGMMCVPKYSNPTGITFSDDVVRRIASMKPAAKDFRIIWDNAYCVHDLYEEGDHLLNILDECKKAGNPDMVIMWVSTSKITFPGSGVVGMAASENNIKKIKKRMAMQTIGYDKINQLRHVRYFKNLDGIKEHMAKHAEIMRPKFEAVQAEFERQLGNGRGIAKWSKPKGGYFINLDVMDGCAKRVGQLCKEAGVVLTPAGATYPYGNDPRDCNIRVAPSFPPIHELELATQLLCICVQLAAVEKLLQEES